jgi:hypothetical protein
MKQNTQENKTTKTPETLEEALEYIMKLEGDLIHSKLWEFSDKDIKYRTLLEQQILDLNRELYKKEHELKTVYQAYNRLKKQKNKLSLVHINRTYNVIIKEQQDKECRAPTTNPITERRPYHGFFRYI